MNPTLKRYILSSVVTFLSSFLTVLAVNLNSLNFNTFSLATVISLILLAVRAALKNTIESAVGGHNDLPSITA